MLPHRLGFFIYSFIELLGLLKYINKAIIVNKSRMTIWPSLQTLTMKFHYFLQMSLPEEGFKETLLSSS